MNANSYCVPTNSCRIQVERNSEALYAQSPTYLHVYGFLKVVLLKDWSVLGEGSLIVPSSPNLIGHIECSSFIFELLAVFLAWCMGTSNSKAPGVPILAQLSVPISANYNEIFMTNFLEMQ